MWMLINPTLFFPLPITSELSWIADLPLWGFLSFFSVGGPVHRWKRDIDTRFPCWYRRTDPIQLIPKLMYRPIKVGYGVHKVGQGMWVLFGLVFFNVLRQVLQIWLHNATWVALASLQWSISNKQFGNESPQDLVIYGYQKVHVWWVLDWMHKSSQSCSRLSAV